MSLQAKAMAALAIIYGAFVYAHLIEDPESPAAATAIVVFNIWAAAFMITVSKKPHNPKKKTK